MEATQNLSNNLIAIRTHMGLSQVSFARRLGISKSTLQDLEKGRSPQLSTVEFIARQLDLPASALISDALPPGQVHVLSGLLRTIGQYTYWSGEDREALLELACQLVQLLSKYTDPPLRWPSPDRETVPL